VAADGALMAASSDATGWGHGTLISGVPGVAPGQRRRDRRGVSGLRGRTMAAGYTRT